MDDIEDYDQQLIDLIEEVDKGVKALRSLKGVEKSDKCAYLQDRLNRAKTVFHSFKLEIKELPREVARGYEKKSKDYNTTMTQLMQELKWAKDQSDRDNLLAGSGGQEPDTMTSAQMLKAGKQIQGESIAALGRAKKQVEQTREVAVDTAVTLKAQTDQLRRIDGELDSMETDLTRAKRELRAFMRNVMTDKLILCFLFMIVCGLIFMIIWSAVNPDSGLAVPEDFKPPIGQTPTPTP